jgi:hypothetical protein
MLCWLGSSYRRYLWSRLGFFEDEYRYLHDALSRFERRRNSSHSASDHPFQFNKYDCRVLETFCLSLISSIPMSFLWLSTHALGLFIRILLQNLRELYCGPMRPVYPIPTLLQHLTDLNKNRFPNLQGGSFWFWHLASLLGNFALF